MNGTLPMFEDHPLPKEGGDVHEYHIFSQLTETKHIQVYFLVGGVAVNGFMETRQGDKAVLRKGVHFSSKLHAIASAAEELIKIKDNIVEDITKLMDKGKAES
jgi:hypothetical protein